MRVTVRLTNQIGMAPASLYSGRLSDPAHRPSPTFSSLPFPHSRMSTRWFASLAADLLRRQEDGEAPKPPHHDSPVVAFIIGLSIILLASILNAAGLNLTKLDHVRFQYSCTSVLFVLTSVGAVVTRYGPVLYPRPNDGKIGCARYGYSECYSTCGYLQTGFHSLHFGS